MLTLNKYIVTLESGRDFFIEASGWEDALFTATDEAARHDDYLVDVEEVLFLLKRSIILITIHG